MTKGWKRLAGMMMLLFALVWTRGITAMADETKEVTYKLSSVSWEGDRLRVEGTFKNNTGNMDIFDFSSGSFVVYDKNKTPILEMYPNITDFIGIDMAPGGTWEYVIERDDCDTDPAAFDVSQFSVYVSFAYNKNLCDGTGCSHCSRRTSEHKTVDVTDELYTIVDDSSADTNVNSGYVPVYVPVELPAATGSQSACYGCGGSGKVFCTHCNGIGYTERREKTTCLVAHHAGCNGHCHGTCHANDYRIVKDYCRWCTKGRATCDVCHGSGKIY